MQIDIREDSPEYTPKIVTVRVECEWEHRELTEGLANLVKHPANGITLDLLATILGCLREKL